MQNGTFGYFDDFKTMLNVNVNQIFIKINLFLQRTAALIQIHLFKPSRITCLTYHVYTSIILFNRELQQYPSIIISFRQRYKTRSGHFPRKERSSIYDY